MPSLASAARIAGQIRPRPGNVASIGSLGLDGGLERPHQTVETDERRRMSGLQKRSQSVGAIEPRRQQLLRALDPIKAPLLSRALQRRRREHGQGDDDDRQQRDEQPTHAEPGLRVRHVLGRIGTPLWSHETSDLGSRFAVIGR
jgi:hypothetical protein